MATALAGSPRLAVFNRLEAELPPGEIARLFVPAPDLVLTEGYKEAGYPKVEVLRAAQGTGPLGRREDRLIALVTDGSWGLGLPRFGLDDADDLARYLVEQVRPGLRGD